jgi:hypothetical protein
MTAAELVEKVLLQYNQALTFDQAIVVAASEAAGDPLDPRTSVEAAVILRAEVLLAQGVTVHDAIGRARADATAAVVAHKPTPARRLNEPAAFAGAVEHSGLVLLERHEVGPHAIEIWARRVEPCTKPPRPSSSPQRSLPSGAFLGTCRRCGSGVGDDEWIFGAWNGERWCFSGRTLLGARRLAPLRPLLCAHCAVRVKYKLIPAPSTQVHQAPV